MLKIIFERPDGEYVTENKITEACTYLRGYFKNIDLKLQKREITCKNLKHNKSILEIYSTLITIIIVEDIKLIKEDSNDT